MSTGNLGFPEGAGKSAAERILHQLKTRGPQVAADLGAMLGITGEAARQQLLRLAAEGLVEASAEARGVGRPRQVWKLTQAGDQRFPDAHADLATQLIRSIRHTLGEEALDLVIGTRETEAKALYAQALAGVEDLGERVARLAAMRAKEGYMAEAIPEGPGWLLVENHCPICAAAALSPGLCRAELNSFQAALGPGAHVERTEHIVAGARRCAYRITPAAG